MSIENTVGKGEIAHNERFLFFPLSFVPFGRTNSLPFSSNSKLSSTNLFSFEESKIRFVGKVKPITRQQILDSSKLKEFANDNFEFDENGRKLSKQVENTVRKGEIACYE